MSTATVRVNRAPVLTLWATIVAERLGHPHGTALTLGKAVAGLTAQSKGRRLGIYEEHVAEPGKKSPTAAPHTVALLGRSVPVKETPSGLRAVTNGRAATPASVERYLEQKFGDALPDVVSAMRAVAASYPPKRLAVIAFDLYESFRPEIPEGVRGWGAKGELELRKIRGTAQKG